MAMSEEFGVAFATMLSFLSTTVLILLYAVFPLLRSFPSSLGFWRAICDLILSVCVYLHNSQDCSPWMGALYQSLMWASLNWYFFLALSLFAAVDNPFKRPSIYMPYYHAWTWATALILALLMIIYQDPDEPFVYDLSVCWAQTEINITIFGTMLLLLIISIVLLGFSTWRLRTGEMRLTFATRLRVLGDIRTFLSAYAIHGISIVILWIYTRIYSPDFSFDSDLYPPWVSVWFSFLIQLKGFVSAIAWLFTQRSDIAKVFTNSHSKLKINSTEKENEAFEDPDEIGDISMALRYEFVLFTSKGIAICTERAHAAIKLARYGEERYLSSRGRDYKFQNVPVSMATEAGINTYLTQPVLEKLTAQVYEERVALTSGRGKHKNVSRHHFTEHAPELFARLRLLSGVSMDNYLDCIIGDETQIRKMQSSFQQGRTASFHFYSLGKRYIIRTLDHQEHAFMKEFLPSYYIFMRNNPNTLISRYMGWYSVKMYGNTEHIVVMENVTLPGDETCGVNQRFDLKGSTIDRIAARKAAIKLDLDLLHTVRLSLESRNRLFNQVVEDVTFLCSHEIMDYSLLLGEASSLNDHQHNHDPKHLSVLIQRIHHCREQLPRHSHCNAKALLSRDSTVVEAEAAQKELEQKLQKIEAKEIEGGSGYEMGKMLNRQVTVIADESVELDAPLIDPADIPQSSSPPPSVLDTPTPDPTAASDSTPPVSVSSPSAETANSTSAVVKESTQHNSSLSDPSFSPSQNPPQLQLQRQETSISIQSPPNPPLVFSSRVPRAREPAPIKQINSNTSTSPSSSSSPNSGGSNQESKSNPPKSNSQLSVIQVGGIQVLRAKRTPRFRQNRAPVIEGPGMYYMGIIDTLNQWRFKKKAEHWTKVLFFCHCRRRAMLSSVEPKVFANRFLFMMGRLLDIKIKSVDISRPDPVELVATYAPPVASTQFEGFPILRSRASISHASAPGLGFYNESSIHGYQ